MMLKALGLRRAPPVAIAILSLLVALAHNAVCDDKAVIPADISQVNAWFQQNVQPLSARKGTLDPNLEAAEANPKVLRVRKDGQGDFKTVTDAVNSIPTGNNQRVIVSIAGGEYREKIKIDRTKPFVTLYGSPNDMPRITYSGTASQFGTVNSASLIVESDFFVASNLIISNTELHVLGDNEMTVITAQARESSIENTGYSFVHCRITGTGTGTYLGRAWRTSPRVIFAYTDMSSVIHPLGWSDNFHPERDRTVMFGEYQCSGPGSNPAGRAKFAKHLSTGEVQNFLSLSYIVGHKWLLPPPRV